MRIFPVPCSMGIGNSIVFLTGNPIPENTVVLGLELECAPPPNTPQGNERTNRWQGGKVFARNRQCCIKEQFPKSAHSH
jgi:hypothetical protein